MNNFFLYHDKFELESGQFLDGLKISYTVKGNPFAEKNIWACHALTGDSNVMEWWGGLFGLNQLFSPVDYRIICANVIGSCYGSTGPQELEEPTSFPDLTTRDLVKAHQLLADYLNIQEVEILIGASLGGQQALEWAIDKPLFAKNLVLVATNAVHSPYGIAFNEAQRIALRSDLTFGLKSGGQEGLKAARAIAMLSYRSYKDFKLKQSDVDRKAFGHRAASYVAYQGEKFENRFNPNSYYTLTKVMDSHDVSRGRSSLEDVLRTVRSKTLVIGVDSDLLFPISEQEFLHSHIPKSEFGVIKSDYGHDAFLIEYEQLQKLVKDFLFNDFKRFKPTLLKQKK
ncbi:MAG: homoserine O-acetyltransferase [Arenicella sp.]|jgi:homoserine O-acetyltransferase